MKKWLKVTLLSVSVVFLSASIAGIIISTNNSIKDSISNKKDDTVEKKDDSNTNSDNTNVVDNDSKKDDSTASYSIELSSYYLSLPLTSTSNLPSDSVVGYFVGDAPSGAKLIWESENLDCVRTSKIMSDPGEPVTISTETMFHSPRRINVYSSFDKTIKKSIIIEQYNNVYKATVDLLGLLPTSGSTFTKSFDLYDGSTTNLAEYTYDTGGKYFHTDAMKTNATIATLPVDIATAKTKENSAKITMSDNAKFELHFSVFPYNRGAAPSWYEKTINGADMNSFIDENSTTAENFIIYGASIVHEISTYDYWEYCFAVKMGSNFKGGDIVFDIDGRYYAITLNQYVYSTTTE